ncbi:hypothetical protein J2Z83_002133 [Virgibacillus natechei]|uniref:Fur-regulated basic protein FbpA n=1 Tax=Virgibacillus natechei TaxID=1216297 RepID=A0ABS4IHH1_9BACI|nr:hypothetical protein [Virgibacillus natechei]
MLKISNSYELHKLREQKKVLKYLIKQDTSEKDKKIHQRTLKEVEEKLEQVTNNIRTCE